MNKKLKFSILLAALTFGIVGCSIGDAPAGQSADEAKAAFENSPPEEQIKLVMSSPMPPDQKAARIAEIRKKYNLPDPGTGAPAGPGGPPNQGSFPGDPRSGQ